MLDDIRIAFFTTLQTLQILLLDLGVALLQFCGYENISISVSSKYLIIKTVIQHIQIMIAENRLFRYSVSSRLEFLFWVSYRRVDRWKVKRYRNLPAGQSIVKVWNLRMLCSMVWPRS